MRKVSSVRSPFAKKLLRLADHYEPWRIWSDFITMFAIAISNQVDSEESEQWESREETYQKISGRYTAEEMATFADLTADVATALAVNPDQDFLGDAYMELGLNNHWTGQFFTPYNICKLMAEMTLTGAVEEIERKGYISLCDPACGAGATLIAGVNVIAGELVRKRPELHWQDHVVVAAQDIDYIVGLMCYIQLSLIGCAGFVKIGDSIADPMHFGDDMAKYWILPAHHQEIRRQLELDNAEAEEQQRKVG